MSKIIVTGAAGFIGSTLVDSLLLQGHQVIGVDEFNDYYDPMLKRKNISHLHQHPLFKMIEGDIQYLDWSKLLEEIDIVFHLAAQAGVRKSWGRSFKLYVDKNITGTQVLLEAAKDAKYIKRFVYASTSSIYGDAEKLPTDETIPPQPVSPYGITKLAAERLGNLYYKNFNLPFVALRFFSVYGPRQRPDMAFHKFFKSAITSQPITVYGDGLQTRDFTFVDDIVAANILASVVPEAVGGIFNVGGGSRVSLMHAISTIEKIVDSPLKINLVEKSMGDARHTAADISKAQMILNYNPKTSLLEGLTQEWIWAKSIYC